MEKRPRFTSRREFIGHAVFAGAAAAFLPAARFLEARGLLDPAAGAPIDLVHDTFNGLLAFIVPGSDAYSIAQGVQTPEPGGVDAGATDVLIATIDDSTPFVPQFSAVVAGTLNFVAQAVNPSAAGAFASPFARLSYAEKAAVFQFMDANESLQLLAGLLPLFVAYFVYSEAGVFDPSTRSLTAQPLGWRLSNYSGVADGRDEFLGYFRKG
jgi:hypothetical protein